MTARSSLVLEGDVCITGKVNIDGALVIKAAPGSCLLVLTRVSTVGVELVDATPSQSQGSRLPQGSRPPGGAHHLPVAMRSGFRRGGCGCRACALQGTPYAFIAERDRVLRAASGDV